jgi:hypothetical protein
MIGSLGGGFRVCIMPKRVAHKSMAILVFLGTNPCITLKLGLTLELNVAEGGEAMFK